MGTNQNNDTLLVQVLKKSGREPACDLTQRIMERVELRASRQARWERSLLLAGAILSGAAILTAGIWITSLTVDAESFASLRNAFAGIGRNLCEIFTPANTTAPGDKFLTGLYCYTAAVFLALSLLGEWLRRKYGSAHE